jgi:hypothetical protein
MHTGLGLSGLGLLVRRPSRLSRWAEKNSDGTVAAAVAEPILMT